MALTPQNYDHLPATLEDGYPVIVRQPLPISWWLWGGVFGGIVGNVLWLSPSWSAPLSDQTSHSAVALNQNNPGPILIPTAPPSPITPPLPTESPSSRPYLPEQPRPSTSPTPNPDTTVPPSPRPSDPTPTPSPSTSSIPAPPAPGTSRQRDPQTLSPTSTRISVDGAIFTHFSQYEIGAGLNTGSQRSTNGVGDLRALMGATITESTRRDGVYRRDYQAWFGRVRSIQQQRIINTHLEVQETAIGFRQQISLMADCPNGVPLGPDGQPQTCTYIPGRNTAPVDPNPPELTNPPFVPTSSVGEIIPPADAAAIRQPGYQGGTDNRYGVDLYVPLVSTREGNTQGNNGTVERQESITTGLTFTVGRMRQVILSNGRENALARTIRGYTYVAGDPSVSSHGVLAAAASLLPDAEPDLAAANNGGKPSFSSTLFTAANNARIPDSSFTTYQVGWGRGAVPTNPADFPAANYHSIWVGLSPVTRRRFSSRTIFIPTGPERVTGVQGNEGGNNAAINVDAIVDGQRFNSAGLSNAYSQGYLTTYERDVNRITRSVFQEQTQYFPHLSFTGNITTADSVLRYYTGAMLISAYQNDPEIVRAYVGVDYTRSHGSGLSYGLGAIAYANPDPDNYSRIQANVAQRIPLGASSSNSLTLSSNFVYAIDGASNIDNTFFQAGNSYVNVGAALDLGAVGLGATYFIPTILPNPVESLLSASLSWRIANNLAIAGYYTPINDNDFRSPFGASLAWRIGPDANSPSIALSWSRNEISFRRGSNPIVSQEDLYGIYFRFGAPANPLTMPRRP